LDALHQRYYQATAAYDLRRNPYLLYN
jgi:hypothetical protein